MIIREFEGTPQEFMKIWFKENNIDNKKKKNEKNLLKKNK
tara:strand:- start:2887 stop:3006 length:120 start_codon:yes stop_codon:yes gene_type:complete